MPQMGCRMLYDAADNDKHKSENNFQLQQH